MLVLSAAGGKSTDKVCHIILCDKLQKQVKFEVFLLHSMFPVEYVYSKSISHAPQFECPSYTCNSPYYSSHIHF